MTRFLLRGMLLVIIKPGGKSMNVNRGNKLGGICYWLTVFADVFTLEALSLVAVGAGRSWPRSGIPGWVSGCLHHPLLMVNR